MVDYSKTHPALVEDVLEREGCPVYFWVGGPANRPLIVLMHGATMDHRMFNAQIEVLIPEYRVLVWDARGHGQYDRTGSIRRDMPHWSKIEPCASYHVIPDAGHNANQDNPAFTNERLLVFLHQYAG